MDEIIQIIGNLIGDVTAIEWTGEALFFFNSAGGRYPAPQEEIDFMAEFLKTAEPPFEGLPGFKISLL